MRRLCRIIGKLFAYILLLFSFLIPRNKKIWIYGSSMGFAGNAKYLFLYTSTVDELKTIWIGNQDVVNTVRQLGLIGYSRYSIKGIIYSLIGGVYIYNSYVNDINLYTFGFAKRINLWHGVGIKNCERKISIGPLAKVFNTRNPCLKLKHLPLFVKPHRFLSTSEQMKTLCRECFAINYNQFIDNMYPRCDIFFFNEGERRRFINKYENDETKNLINSINEYTYVYLYMPTWRDSGFDFLADFDFQSLNTLLKDRNELMLMKLHPVTRLNQDAKYSNIIIVNKLVDLNPLMIYTDCLITDYSSVYYDYITIPNKRLILYIPDYNHYISQDRDLAFDYMDSTDGEFAYDFNELITLISNRSLNTYQYKHIDELRQRFWGNAIGSNSENLYNKIKASI